MFLSRGAERKVKLSRSTSQQLSVPDHDSAINTAGWYTISRSPVPTVRRSLTAELSQGAPPLIICTNCGDGILMCRLQLCVVLCLPLEIHLAEHIESGFFPCITHLGTDLCLDRARKLPATLAAMKAIWFAVLCKISEGKQYGQQI